jgi:hypothetical protein
MEVNFMLNVIYNVFEIFNLLIWNYEDKEFSQLLEIFDTQNRCDAFSSPRM